MQRRGWNVTHQAYCAPEQRLAHVPFLYVTHYAKDSSDQVLDYKHQAMTNYYKDNIVHSVQCHFQGRGIDL